MEQQIKRFNKLNYESFFLLKVETNDLGFELKISGSTRNIYTIQINKNSRNLKCDCPDSKSWALHHNCFCKHICFVLLRMFKEIYNQNSRIFQEKIISLEDYDFLERKLINMDITKEEEIINTDLLERFKNLKTSKNEFINDIVKEDEMCPICFLDIVTENVKCPECSNIIHKECMEKWLEMGNKTCVYCRSPVWQNYTLENDYLSLN